MITILDGQTDVILDDISKKNILFNEHTQSLQDMQESFDFDTYGDKRFSQYLTKRNRIIIPGEDGEFREFIIAESERFRDGKVVKIGVYSYASYLDLTKAKIIKATETPAWTAEQHAAEALDGTEWEVGTAEFEGVRSLIIETPTNPFSYLKRVASEFDLELRFYIETNGNKVIGRYVDLVKPTGEWRGREVIFGTDLAGIKRTESTENIVTALVGLGPEREDGTRLEVFVEDKDALARWGRKGQHLIEVYEPQSDQQNMTLEELEQYTRAELNKRINEIVTYEIDVNDLENVPGLDHKKIRFGDRIKIKDTKFSPPLYIEARVYEQVRSITDKSQKRVKLGDYTEYTEDDVRAIWKRLQEQIQRKISLSDALEVVYTKEEVDERDEPGKQAKERLDIEVGEAIIESVDGAQQKAQQAEQNAISHTETVKQQIEEDVTFAFERLDGIDGKINNAVTTIDETGVTVKDGSFFLEDDSVDTKYTIVPTTNLVQDHSFELVETAETPDDQGFYDVIPNSDAFYKWATVGSPKMVSTVDSDDAAAGPIFGNKSAIVNKYHYFRQSIPFNAGKTYTASAYFAPTSYNPQQSARPLIRVELFDPYGDLKQAWETESIAVYHDSPVRRVSLTFTVPEDAQDGLGGDSLSISVMSTLYYIKVDGVQVVEGDSPALYETEGNFWRFMNGVKGNEASFIITKEILANQVSIHGGGRIYSDGNKIRTAGLPLNVGHGLESYGVYVNRTTSGANLAIVSDYSFARSSSSRKYKKDIEDLDREVYMKVLDLRPVWYRDIETNADARPDWSRVGLVAEEVHEIEPRLVYYEKIEEEIEDENGNKITRLIPHDELVPEGVQYDRLAVYMIPILKEHHQEIAELKQELTSLREQLKQEEV